MKQFWNRQCKTRQQWNLHFLFAWNGKNLHTEIIITPFLYHLIFIYHCRVNQYEYIEWANQVLKKQIIQDSFTIQWIPRLILFFYTISILLLSFPKEMGQGCINWCQIAEHLRLNLITLYYSSESLFLNSTFEAH